MAKVLETDEAGALVLPSEVLGSVGANIRYRVEQTDNGLLVKPEARTQTETASADEWLAQWDDLSEKVSASWKSDKSAVEIISEMRR